MSKVYCEIGGGPVPGHSGPVAQLLQAVAPPAVAVAQLRQAVAPPAVVGQAGSVRGASCWILSQTGYGLSIGNVLWIYILYDDDDH